MKQLDALQQKTRSKSVMRGDYKFSRNIRYTSIKERQKNQINIHEHLAKRKSKQGSSQRRSVILPNDIRLNDYLQSYEINGSSPRRSTLFSKDRSPRKSMIPQSYKFFD